MAPSQADVNIKIVFPRNNKRSNRYLAIKENSCHGATTAENFNLLRRPDNGMIVDMNLSLRPSNPPNPIYNVRIFEGKGLGGGGRNQSTSRTRGVGGQRERDKRTRIGNSEMYKITSSDPMTHYTDHAVYSRISMDLGRVKGRSRYDPGSRVLTLAESIDSRRFTADPVKSCAKFREVRTIEAGKDRL